MKAIPNLLLIFSLMAGAQLYAAAHEVHPTTATVRPKGAVPVAAEKRGQKRKYDFRDEQEFVTIHRGWLEGASSGASGSNPLLDAQTRLCGCLAELYPTLDDVPSREILWHYHNLLKKDASVKEVEKNLAACEEAVVAAREAAEGDKKVAETLEQLEPFDRTTTNILKHLVEAPYGKHVIALLMEKRFNKEPTYNEQLRRLVAGDRKTNLLEILRELYADIPERMGDLDDSVWKNKEFNELETYIQTFFDAAISNVRRLNPEVADVLEKEADDNGNDATKLVRFNDIFFDDPMHLNIPEDDKGPCFFYQAFAEVKDQAELEKLLECLYRNLGCPQSYKKDMGEGGEVTIESALKHYLARKGITPVPSVRFVCKKSDAEHIDGIPRIGDSRGDFFGDDNILGAAALSAAASPFANGGGACAAAASGSSHSQFRANLARGASCGGSHGRAGASKLDRFCEALTEYESIDGDREVVRKLRTVLAQPGSEKHELLLAIVDSIVDPATGIDVEKIMKQIEEIFGA